MVPKACIGRKLNTPWKSDRKFKKFQVCAKDKYSGEVKNIHFGDNRFEDFTQHRDKTRRANYLSRSAGIKDGQGRLTKDNPGSANFWARKKLW
jgi:hypothetical protein